MTEHHIVKNVRVSGVNDKQTTQVSFNEQVFVFSPEAFDKFFHRVCERKKFLDEMKRLEERAKLGEA